MNINTGTTYPTYEKAKKAGEKDEDLVMGTKEALDKLKKKLVFTKGSFKSVNRQE